MGKETKTWNEAEIIQSHNKKASNEKSNEEIQAKKRTDDINKKDQEQANLEITIPKTPPDIMVSYLKHYFGLKDIDEVTKHKLENIYQWASKNTKGITPEDTLDTLDLLGEQLGVNRFGDNKFSIFNQYITLYNTKEQADKEIKSLESKWAIFNQV